MKVCRRRDILQLDGEALKNSTAVAAYHVALEDSETYAGRVRPIIGDADNRHVGSADNRPISYLQQSTCIGNLADRLFIG